MNSADKHFIFSAAMCFCQKREEHGH